MVSRRVPRARRLLPGFAATEATCGCYVAPVTAPGSWPSAVLLQSERLQLEPLRIEHAQEAAVVFDDVRLHAYTGGSPSSYEQLRDRYGRQVAGHSPDGSQGWLNWILRLQDTGEIVGTVQATLRRFDDGTLEAEVAWVIATSQQRNGYGREAATAMTSWLRMHGVGSVVAHIHPHHRSSIAVAQTLGLVRTDVVVDGEVRWTDAVTGQ